MQIGFIGLGTMGRAMVRRLIQAGHQVTVWNRSPGPVKELAAEGARTGADPAAVFQPPIVMSMLADDTAVRATILDSGVLEDAACQVHINLATVSAGFAREISQRHAEAGIGYVAAPVLGRPEVALTGPTS